MGFRFNPSAPELWTTNAVVSGRNRSYHVEPLDGTLSIKATLAGSGVWETPDGRYEVTPDTFLILNNGQNYRLDIEDAEVVHTFCVFLKPGFVRDFGFYERLRLMTPLVGACLARLRTALDEGAHDGLEADDAMADLAEALFQSESAPAERERLNLASPVAREDAFRRLNAARDMALSQIGERLSLDSLADAAFMSPFHFHRVHREVFHETPHEFVTRARLQRAKRLLHRARPVGEVAIEVGFESVPSFVRLFRRHVGITPGAFRARVIRN